MFKMHGSFFASDLEVYYIIFFILFLCSFFFLFCFTCIIFRNRQAAISSKRRSAQKKNQDQNQNSDINLFYVHKTFSFLFFFLRMSIQHPFGMIFSITAIAFFKNSWIFFLQLKVSMRPKVIPLLGNDLSRNHNRRSHL